MSVVIANVEPSTDTFQIWIDKCNESFTTLALTVTVNNHANGDLTTGNGFVEGTFGGRNLTANTLRGGTVATPNTLYISSNVNINVSSILEVGVISVNSTDISVNGVSIASATNIFRFSNATVGTSAQEINNFSKLSFRSAEYHFSIKDDNANAYQVSKILVVHNGGDAFVSEYGVVFSNTHLGEFSANANSTHVRVHMTPTVANTTLQSFRILTNL